MFTQNHRLQLTANNKVFIDTMAMGDIDTCSIQTIGGFASGVVTVKKANSIQGTPVDLAGSPVTISSATMTQLTGSDWFKCRYLVLEVTTAASPTTTIIELELVFKKLGFSI